MSAEPGITTRLPRRTGGRPRRGEDPIGRLLDVAERRFLRDGYVETSIDALAREASISKKTIYARFENKGKLFEAIVRRLGERVLGADLDDDDDLPFREGLRLRLRRMEAASVDPAVIAINRLAARQGPHFPELAETLRASGFERYQVLLARYLRGCVTRGLIRPIDCDTVADLILGAMSAPLTYAVIFGTEPNGAENALQRADRLCDLVVSGLLAR